MLGQTALPPVPAAERRVPELQRSEGSGLGPGKLAALRELPRLRLRLAYGVALLVPSRAHLRSRGLRRSDLWSRP